MPNIASIKTNKAAKYLVPKYSSTFKTNVYGCWFLEFKFGMMKKILRVLTQLSFVIGRKQSCVYCFCRSLRSATCQLKSVTNVYYLGVKTEFKPGGLFQDPPISVMLPVTLIQIDISVTVTETNFDIDMNTNDILGND